MIESLLKDAIKTSLLAGEKIMEFYRSNQYNIQTKSDQSPVTEADFASHEIICNQLKNTNLKVLSEEGDAQMWTKIRKEKRYWLIDPLDGTKEFINANGEFTVNIALIENQKPILGVIYIPAQKVLYAGAIKLGAWRWDATALQHLPNWEKFTSLSQTLPLSRQRTDFRVLGSKSFRTSATDNFIQQLKQKTPNLTAVRAGSSIKFCMIASGEADLYPRLDAIMEWDVAAGHAIVEASGGSVKSIPTGANILYNSTDMRFVKFIATTNGIDESVLQSVGV